MLRLPGSRAWRSRADRAAAYACICAVGCYSHACITICATIREERIDRAYEVGSVHLVLQSGACDCANRRIASSCRIATAQQQGSSDSSSSVCSTETVHSGPSAKRRPSYTRATCCAWIASERGLWKPGSSKSEPFSRRNSRRWPKPSAGQNQMNPPYEPSLAAPRDPYIAPACSHECANGT